MKFLKTTFLILLLNSLVGEFSAYAQKPHIQKEVQLLLKNLEENHIQPRHPDHQLSLEILENFIDLLDHDRIIFLKEDIEKLKDCSDVLVDDFQGTSWKFYPLLSKLLKERLQQSLEILEGLNEEMINTFKNEIYVLGDTTYPENTKDQSVKWAKAIKHQSLFQLARETHHKEDNELTNILLTAQESEIIKKIIINRKRSLKKLLNPSQGYENNLSSLFLNSIISCYDAHSSYFSKTEWENFQGMLSTENYSFGLELDENEIGEIYIKNLVPGGPAWNSNELFKSDVLLKVKWFGKEEISLSGVDLYELKSLLSEHNYETLELTVKNTEGLIKAIKLKKSKIQNEGNIVKSCILNGKKKIGYISLPGFYSEWENSEGKGCANDVAKEIFKLKKENIEGLILDVRNNGGGSLSEGLDLTGIFIDQGPLVILKGKDGKPQVIKDPNRGTAYDGPLVLMVNGQSASASEVLAATLQDYNRAVIVGSPTFGKATGQDIIPLEKKFNNLSDFNSQYGLATITSIKIYRVTGNSAQKSGVIPDIILPDFLDLWPYKEESLPYALPKDSVPKKLSLAQYNALPLNDLKEKNKTRLSESPYFKEIQENLDQQITSRVKIETLHLDIDSYRKSFRLYFDFEDFLNTPFAHSSEKFEPVTSRYDNGLLDVDAYLNEVNENFKRNIKEDIYIEECYQIINDLIDSKK